MAPIWAMLSDVRVEVDEVLAVNDDALAVLIRLAGHDEHGGAFELPVGQVLRYRDGVGVSVDQYDPSDRETMLRRFAELTGGSPVRQTDPLPLRLDAEERRRYNAHDLELARAASPTSTCSSTTGRSVGDARSGRPARGNGGRDDFRARHSQGER